MLSCSELEVADFINTFLSEARSVIEGHMAGQTEQSAPVLTELSLLIIYCIEVSVLCVVLNITLVVV